jgi:hypothetical protein
MLTDTPSAVAGNLITTLLDARLVDAAAVLGGRVGVVDLSRRNAVHGIVVDAELRHVVKLLPPVPPWPEADAYTELAALAGSDAFLPVHRLISGMLIVEVAPGTTTFPVHRAEHGLGLMSAHLVGRSLRALHDLGIGSGSSAEPRPLPGLLGIPVTMTPASWWATSGANRQLFSALHQLPSQPLEALGRLGDLWRPRAWVHGDLKFDNLVIENDRSEPRARPMRVRLIDWEFASPGDPGWDLGSLVAQVLHEWLSSMKVAKGHDVSLASEGATVPLSDGDRWFAQLLATYGQHDLDSDSMFRFAGARLLQFAYERNSSLSRISPTALAVAQVGANLLDDPLGTAHRAMPRTMRALGG